MITTLPNIGTGSKTIATAGSRERLVATNTPCGKVTLVANVANTGNVYVGGSAVSSTSGVPLIAGQSMTMDIEDLYALFLDTDTNSNGVTFTYFF